ncbi:protein S-acyltransferase 11-like isoform X1 [Carex littledalei]|uniref:S-acyltransferase n=1 Tax=Carex littledalei TaxID=544730 RepID=A0A833VW31_9POAL|nr:protein S-acyltransferase 11-like isoform X1 [Carex littledalei]
MEEEQTVQEENNLASVSEECQVTCWGCGLRLILATYSPAFKCGWCGAITQSDLDPRKADSRCFSQWRRVRDRFFVLILMFFILFIISAGVWAVYPIIFSISTFCGIFHITLTAGLSIATIFTFFMAAFRSPGTPPTVIWGSYPIVNKNDLNDYTLCVYCSRPKPPRAHHCRSCKMCVMDMDHHCPFIGNCVGAANHLAFILFLISVVISCTYVTIMAVYSGYHVWPPLDLSDLGTTVSVHSVNVTRLLKVIFEALARSTLLLSARGLILVYLAFAGFAVEIGISVLLWQQLSYIYDGVTYVNSISSTNVGYTERGWKNLVQFFGCPYSIKRLFLFRGFGNWFKSQDGGDSSSKTA